MHFRRAPLIIASIVIILSFTGSIALAGSAKISKKVVPVENGEFMIKLRVTAIGSSIYALKLIDEESSIVNIYAPKGWCMITDSEELIARTGEKAIKPGKSVEFIIYTSSRETTFKWETYGIFKKLGKGGVI